MKYIKWRVNYNRPLSHEERAIAERLATDPTARVAPAAQSWHSAVTSEKAHAKPLQPEEA